MRIRDFRVLGIAVLFLLGPFALRSVAAPAAGEPAVGPPQPRATMQEMFTILSGLMPLALDEERFSDPDQFATIGPQLTDLVTISEQIEGHAKTGRDFGYRYLSRSLQQDLAEARDRFLFGQPEVARYFLLESTHNCVACHSQRPAARDFPLGDLLVEQVTKQDLAPASRAQLYVTARRFSSALDVWEQSFADPSQDPATLSLDGQVAAYLAIAIRTQQGFERAQKTLAKLAARPDAPNYLRKRWIQWSRDLEAQAKLGARPPTLANARQLLERSRPGDALGGDRLISDLIASALLTRYIDAAESAGPGMAEAYYWLGVTGVRSIDDYWVPQAEFNLEVAIRLDPKGPYAQPALDLLEEYIVLGYGGASGSKLPADVWSKLEELRALVAGETPPV